MDHTSGAVGEYSHRMLKKTTFAPAQPRRAKTRRSTGKAAAPSCPAFHLSRFTFHGFRERCGRKREIRPGGVLVAGVRVLDRTGHG